MKNKVVKYFVLVMCIMLAWVLYHGDASTTGAHVDNVKQIVKTVKTHSRKNIQEAMDSVKEDLTDDSYYKGTYLKSLAYDERDQIQDKETLKQYDSTEIICIRSYLVGGSILETGLTNDFGPGNRTTITFYVGRDTIGGWYVVDGSEF